MRPRFPRECCTKPWHRQALGKPSGQARGGLCLSWCGKAPSCWGLRFSALPVQCLDVLSGLMRVFRQLPLRYFICKQSGCCFAFYLNDMGLMFRTEGRGWNFSASLPRLTLFAWKWQYPVIPGFPGGRVGPSCSHRATILIPQYPFGRIAGIAAHCVARCPSAPVCSHVA